MKSKFSIAIPASLVAEKSHLRDKTRVIGRIGRSAAIFRVQEIIIYSDKPNESNLIQSILSYMETPQYLRKHLIRKQPELRYVGSLPPLRTPHHPLVKHVNDLRKGEYREGVVLRTDKGKAQADIGVELPIYIDGTVPPKGSRITIKINEKSPILMGEHVDKNMIQKFWGYSVKIVKGDLRNYLSKPNFDLRIATSRLGVPINEHYSEVQNKVFESEKILVVFGSYKEGLHKIVGGHDILEKLFDFNLNMIPSQGTATVRVEEAVHAALGILNVMLG